MKYPDKERYIVEYRNTVRNFWDFWGVHKQSGAAYEDLTACNKAYPDDEFRIWDNILNTNITEPTVFVKAPKLSPLSEIDPNTPTGGKTLKSEMRIEDFMKYTLDKTKKPLQVQFIGGPLDGTELDPNTGETTDRYAIERTANCNDSIPEGYHHHYQMILEWSGTDLIYLGVKENGFKYSTKNV